MSPQAVQSFVDSGTLPPSDEMDMPLARLNVPDPYLAPMSAEATGV